MNLYFVRHGESEANILREISNRGYKHGLTEKGRQQAKALAERFKDVPVSNIYSSPLRRAVETSQILASALGIEMEIADALREFDCGILEGKSDEASWKIWEAHFIGWRDPSHWEDKIEGGESLIDIKNRLQPFIQQIIQEYQSKAEGIILVGHGGTFMMALPFILNNINVEFVSNRWMMNTDYILGAVQPDGSILCMEWCGEKIETA